MFSDASPVRGAIIRYGSGSGRVLSLTTTFENPALDEILDDEGDKIMDELSDRKEDPIAPTKPSPTSYITVRKLLDFPKTKIRLIVSKHADYSSII